MHLFLQSYPQHHDEGAELLGDPGWVSGIWAVAPKRSYNRVGEVPAHGLFHRNHPCSCHYLTETGL